MATTQQRWLNGLVATVAGAAVIGSFTAVRELGRLEERLNNQVGMMVRFQQQYADDYTIQNGWQRQVDRDLASLKEWRQQQRDRDYRQ